MSADTDDLIVAGIVLRLEAIDDLIPEPRDWWGDDAPTARVPVRVTAGPALGGASTSLIAGRRKVVIVAVAAVIAALIGAVMLIASQPHPHLTTNGLIAYEPGSRDYSGIMVIDPSTRTDRVLADVDVNDCLEYSPDGRRLAVTLASGDLGLIDSASGKLRILRTMTIDGPISWSPDGTRVAGIAWSGDVSDGIRVVPIPTGTVTRIDAGGYRIFDLSWSPDGRRIAYVAAATLDETVINPALTLNVVGADGSGKTKLITLPSETHVAWSPDGTQLLFARYPHDTIVPADGSGPEGQRDIVSLSIEDRTERNLTQTSDDEAGAAWSPDGRRIAFMRAIAHPDAETEHQVVTMAPDGTQVIVQPVTGGPGSARIVWSPDSKQLLMYGYRGGGQGGSLTILAADAARPPFSLVVQGPVTFEGCGPTWQPIP